MTIKSANPTLYIIAGCNGAGKTTASMVVLPEILNCREFVNADKIAKGLSPLNPEEVAIEAGRLMLERINLLISKNVTFAIETTLATRSYTKLIDKARAKGYNIILLFFWLPNPEMAKQRVAQRVASGGHNIPSDVISRRYQLGIDNLFDLYIPVVDTFSVYDNSNAMQPIVVNNHIINQDKFDKITNLCQKKKK